MPNNEKATLDLSQHVIPFEIDGPISITLDGNAKELTIKGYMTVSGEVSPVQAQVRFTAEASGSVIKLVSSMIENGLVSLETIAREIQ